MQNNSVAPVLLERFPDDPYRLLEATIETLELARKRWRKQRWGSTLDVLAPARGAIPAMMFEIVMSRLEFFDGCLQENSSVPPQELREFERVLQYARLVGGEASELADRLETLAGDLARSRMQQSDTSEGNS